MKKVRFLFPILFVLIAVESFSQDFDTLNIVKKGAKLTKV
jgi:hypothetical protein